MQRHTIAKVFTRILLGSDTHTRVSVSDDRLFVYGAGLYGGEQRRTLGSILPSKHDLSNIFFKKVVPNAATVAAFRRVVSVSHDTEIGSKNLAHNLAILLTRRLPKLSLTGSPGVSRRKLSSARRLEVAPGRLLKNSFFRMEDDHWG